MSTITPPCPASNYGMSPESLPSFPSDCVFLSPLLFQRPDTRRDLVPSLTVLIYVPVQQLCTGNVSEPPARTHARTLSSSQSRGATAATGVTPTGQTVNQHNTTVSNKECFFYLAAPLLRPSTLQVGFISRTAFQL